MASGVSSTSGTETVKSIRIWRSSSARRGEPVEPERGEATGRELEGEDRGRSRALVVAIGPPIMMKFCAETTRPYEVPTVVSLNTIMIDGTGMCGGCRVTVGDETKFVCVDGPEFDGHQVDYDELMQRLQAYCEDEKACHDDFCKIRS